MKAITPQQCRLIAFLFAVCLVGVLSLSASAIPSFQSSDWRLPNPDRPYEMTSGTVTEVTSGTVTYDTFDFAIHDLELQIAIPEQLDTPTFNFELNRLEFDSTFDVTVTAQVSRGLEPPHPLFGGGSARAIGFTRPVEDAPFGFIHPQVFDMQLVSLDLVQHTTRPEIALMLRESPKLQSKGVTIREDPCPLCLAPFTHWIISSYFDISTEVSFDGGVSWSPASGAIHVEQAPDGFPPGDYNQDKKVDAADYVVWRNSLGLSGAGLAADGDWSGEIDAGDYEVWKANYGRANAFGTNVSSQVPEPGSMLPLIVSALFLFFSRRPDSSRTATTSRKPAETNLSFKRFRPTYKWNETGRRSF